MIKYNPRTWFTQIVMLPKSDTLRVLWVEIVMIAIYTAVLTYVEHMFWENEKLLKSTISIHSLVGFVMGMFLVFRTNTAYDRWWEGRKQWGALVNASRNLSIKLVAFSQNKNSGLINEIKLLLQAYPFAAKEHLRDKNNLKEIDLPEELKNELINYKHLPNAISLMLYKRFKLLYNEKIITGEELIIIDSEMRELTNIIGACERIKTTPIPFSYSSFIKKFIFIYCVTLPIGLIPDFKYWSVPITMFVFYIMVSLEILAEEIEDPFGYDENDLPTDEISEKIKISTGEIF